MKKFNIPHRFQELIDRGNKIYIISGEGTGEGRGVIYTGKRTALAITRRLTKERCGGDRWARALMELHVYSHGCEGVDLETGESGHIR